jgi:hypothetical protein
MSDADRIQRWRQRMRDEGKEPMSLWLSRDTKLRLEDMAATWHCSPSELVEQALAQFHPGNPSVPGTVADTELLQAMLADAARALLPTLKSEILHELRPAHAPSPAVLDTNKNVTETSPQEPATAPEHDHSRVTEPTPTRKGGRRHSALGQQILDLLAQHREGLTAEQIRGYLTPSKPLGDTLQGMKKTGAVRTEGTGKQVRYCIGSLSIRDGIARTM